MARDRTECVPDCPVADETPPALSWGHRWGGALNDGAWAVAANATGVYVGGQFASRVADFGANPQGRTTPTSDPDAAFLSGFSRTTGLLSGLGARFIDGDSGAAGDSVKAVALDGSYLHVVGSIHGQANFGGGLIAGSQGFHASYRTSTGGLDGNVYRMADVDGLTDVAVVSGRVFVVGYYSIPFDALFPRCGGGASILLPGAPSGRSLGFVAELGDECVISAMSLGTLRSEGLTRLALAVAPDASRVVVAWRVPDPGGRGDIVLGVLPATLDALTTTTYASTGDDGVTGLVIDGENHLFAGGFVANVGELRFGDGPLIIQTGDAVTSTRGFVVSLTLDNPPRHRWTRTLPDYGAAVRWVSLAANGDIVFGGNTGVAPLLGFAYFAPARLLSGALVARFTSLGAHRWSFLLDGDEYDSSSAGAVAADDSLFFALETNSPIVTVNGVDLALRGQLDALVVGALPAP